MDLYLKLQQNFGVLLKLINSIHDKQERLKFLRETDSSVLYRNEEIASKPYVDNRIESLDIPNINNRLNELKEVNFNKFLELKDLANYVRRPELGNYYTKTSANLIFLEKGNYVTKEQLAEDYASKYWVELKNYSNKNELNQKLDKLTPGKGITIENGTISASVLTPIDSELNIETASNNFAAGAKVTIEKISKCVSAEEFDVVDEIEYPFVLNKLTELQSQVNDISDTIQLELSERLSNITDKLSELVDTTLNPETADNEHAAGALVTTQKLSELDAKIGEGFPKAEGSFDASFSDDFDSSSDSDITKEIVKLKPLRKQTSDIAAEVRDVNNELQKKYEKPASGIPSSDLTVELRSLIGSAISQSSLVPLLNNMGYSNNSNWMLNEVMDIL